jgi:hypothetical protein
MSQSLVSLYRKTFIVHNAQVYHRTYEWHPYKDDSYFNQKLIQKHLDGELLLGQKLPLQRCVQFFVLDFDYKETVSREQWEHNIVGLVNRIETPKIGLTSSDKNNYHFYFFIKRIDPCIIRSKVDALVGQYDFKTFGGNIDRFYANYTLRLPFGEGSYPVEIQNGELVKILDKESYLITALDRIWSYKFPTLYQGVPNVNVTSKSINIGIPPTKQEFDSTQILINYGLSTPGRMNEACMQLVRYYYAKTNGDLDLTRERVQGWVEEFSQQHRSLSKEFRDRPDQLFAKIDSMVTNWAGKCSGRVVDTSKVNIPEELCKEIFRAFKDTPSIQFKVFRLLQYVYKHANERTRTLFLPYEVLNKKEYGILLNKHTTEVMTALMDNSILTLLVRGSNHKKHPSLYQLLWDPVSYDTLVYCSYAQFLKDNQLDGMYTKYYRDLINDMISSNLNIREVTYAL